MRWFEVHRFLWFLLIEVLLHFTLRIVEGKFWSVILPGSLKVLYLLFAFSFIEMFVVMGSLVEVETFDYCSSNDGAKVASFGISEVDKVVLVTCWANKWHIHFRWRFHIIFLYSFRMLNLLFIEIILIICNRINLNIWSGLLRVKILIGGWSFHCYPLFSLKIVSVAWLIILF